MKVEISIDQNTLTVDGVEYEAKVAEKCVGCSFTAVINQNRECLLQLNSIQNRYCTAMTRNDEIGIIWIKKENTEMTKAPAPAPALQHRHFDLIVQWAKNPTQTVWAWSKVEWVRVRVESPSWTMNHYAIGEKPTEPPVKMVKYDGGSIEFPEPARVELEHNKQYWAATIYGADPDYWAGHSADFDLLDAGLIQLTSEGAEKQPEALVELLKNHAQKWG